MQPAAADRRLRPSERVKKRPEFVRLQEHPGARFRAPSFLVLLSERATPRPERRLGVVASRRLGGAVQRNRAKRLLRELFRLDKERFPAGADVVLIAQAPILLRALPELRRELEAIATEMARRFRALAARRPRGQSAAGAPKPRS